MNQKLFKFIMHHIVSNIIIKAKGMDIDKIIKLCDSTTDFEDVDTELGTKIINRIRQYIMQCDFYIDNINMIKSLPQAQIEASFITPLNDSKDKIYGYTKRIWNITNLRSNISNIQLGKLKTYANILKSILLAKTQVDNEIGIVNSKYSEGESSREFESDELDNSPEPAYKRELAEITGYGQDIKTVSAVFPIFFDGF